MNLEAIADTTKSAVILLVNEKGEIKDSYLKEKSELDSYLKKIGVFAKVILNMSEDFFDSLFEAQINDITLKTGGKSMFLYKHDEKNLLCFFSDKNINTALIGLTLKKI